MPARSRSARVCGSSFCHASIEAGDNAQRALHKLDTGLVAAASLMADNLDERFGAQYEQIAAGGEA